MKITFKGFYGGDTMDISPHSKDFVNLRIFKDDKLAFSESVPVGALIDYLIDNAGCDSFKEYIAGLEV